MDGSDAESTLDDSQAVKGPEDKGEGDGWEDDDWGDMDVSMILLLCLLFDVEETFFSANVGMCLYLLFI